MNELVRIESEAGPVACYVARPSGSGRAGVLVLHAWWGLTDHFKRVCDRLASHGYVALAPDFFRGETAETPERAEQLAQGASEVDCSAITEAALNRLKELAPSKTGVVGFSFGSYWALWIAAKRPDDVDAVVPFYTDTDADVVAIPTPMQWHFAEKDEFVPDEWVEELRRRLTKSGRGDVETHVYPGTAHAFFNTSRPEAYKPEEAELAWERMLGFLENHLS
jgi:carboxymethylenebutenolidase